MNNLSKPQIDIVPPSLMKALTAGFDVISKQIGLIFFSITLDVLLWFGPRLKLAQLFEKTISHLQEVPEWQTPEMLESVKGMAETFNLLSALRTIPVGIPSLMASRGNLDTPMGTPWSWEIPSFGIALALWLALTVIGLYLGSFYFSLVSKVSLGDNISWKQIFNQFPWTSTQIFYLTIIWLVSLLIVFLPFSCIFSFLMLYDVGIGQCALLATLLIGGLLIWLFIPMIFSPHGIFVNQKPTWLSIKDGFHITRMTLPTTILLLFVFLLLGEGLDALWSVPPGASWWTLVGICGHAFVTSSLLAASFIYYRDAYGWIKAALEHNKLSIT